MIRGSNNGTWGYGMHRAMFPKLLGGPLGYKNVPLPNAFQHHDGKLSYKFGKRSGTKRSGLKKRSGTKRSGLKKRSVLKKRSGLKKRKRN